MKTVLAIDESATIRELIAFVLGNAGYKVVSAEDGLSGLEQLESLAPDVVITGLSTPCLDGLGFIQRARQCGNSSATPILILGNDSDSSKKPLAKATGATGWISKPFNPNRLIEAVRRVSH